MFLSAFFAGVCHRFPPVFLISNTWYRWPVNPLVFVQNTFYTRNLSIHDLFQNPGTLGYTLMLWPKLKPWNRGLHKNQVLRNSHGLNKTPNAVLHKNYVIHKSNVLHKHHVLARPVQALFAACRIALSMVAGGTRRRRLNRTRTKKCWGFLCKMLTSFRKSDICTKTYFESHIGGACLLSVTQVIPFKHFQTTKETCPAQAHVSNICMFASILSMFCRTVPLQAISRRGT